MCGIYWLHYTKSYKPDVKLINTNFNKGSGRGPDNSKFDELNNNIMGFHRLSINDLSSNGDQPFIIDSYALVCNGEIYNHKELIEQHNITMKSSSDCEVIIHLFKMYGISKTLNLLDGVFAFVLFDLKNDQLFVARDPFGVRPLFISQTDNYIEVSSEIKMTSTDPSKCVQFCPGKCAIFSKFENNIVRTSFYYYFNLDLKTTITKNINDKIYNSLEQAVKKRVENTEKPIGCLLSGGLDSSIIASLVQKYSDKKLRTFSIGLEGSVDIKYSRIMANYLDSEHHEFIVSEEEMLSSIPAVIRTIESYDTTTVRASVGNWLIGKKIKEVCDSIVIFNGDGSDEVTGGYLYFRAAPSEDEFDLECKRLLSHIHYFDVLRSDRTISFHGLEARTPFLDKTFVETYLKIDKTSRVSQGKRDKFLLRESFKHILPEEIYKRNKEAFSDGVSSKKHSWYEIIQTHLESKQVKYYRHNTPKTPEQSYYRETFNLFYKNYDHVIPYFWMPKFINAQDSSARTLKIYA